MMRFQRYFAIYEILRGKTKKIKSRGKRGGLLVAAVLY
ncbi:hypothetical protein BROSI_A2343 [Candidatus Brocadia sinica JPN1]|uniref:Uncharacterized protein n=1 Tax=Candidatus Brocadia sinica JPN1 TaxID=1197129 RepID=A0ABQ0JZ99_9BACT|nr:hypothetical protein BROSI_A2343 [Candidatus Brocadia sinica JPN1]